MLNNKKFNIVLSLIIAVGLWAYVIGETNPADTKTFRDIPIQMLNQQELSENQLAILSASAESISVTLTGSRSDINRVDEKEIVASIDLADVAVGENDLKINIKVPDNVELDDKSHNKVTLVVEKRISREVEIVPEYAGTFSAEQEPITVEMSRDKVTVTGAESLVNRVDHVCASIAEEKVSEQMRTVTCSLVPVDKKGVIVNRLELSAETVQVTSELVAVKTVAMQVPVTDRASEEAERTYSAPRTITLKGKKSVLQSIDTVIAEPVDISNVMESGSIPIVPVLPEGVQVSTKSLENLFVSVTVVPLETKTFAFDIEEIQIKNGEDLQLYFHWTNKIEVTVRGKQEQLDAIEKADIHLSADLKKLSAGVHEIPLKVSCEKEYAAIFAVPEELKVTIE